MFTAISHFIQQRIIRSEFFRFALVGGAGFVVDISVFTGLLYLLELPIMPTRIVAFICAASATWWGNRIYTFSAGSSARLRQWLRFFTSACLSAIPNLGVFSLVLMQWGDTGVIPYLALVGGILAGMVSNYFLCRLWVFTQ